ncbi:MAG: DUF3667 domain-containing protein [Bacteroidales bacterium]
MAKSRVRKTECPNCGYKLSQAFNYCPSCGQENHTHKLPFKHFVGEFLETLFHFDNKLLVTLRDLFIPGRMTLNYNQNKRGRYVPPVRLYIFVTFIFFLIVTLSSKLENQSEEGESGDRDSTLISVNVFGIEADTAWHNQIQNSQEPGKLINEFIRKEYPDAGWVMKKMIRNLLLINTGHIGKEELMHKLHKGISGSMFVLMPVFAFFLWLFYWGRKIFYSEHLVFSLHFHTLMFIIFSLWFLLNLLNLHIGLVFFIAILAYLLLSLKHVFAQGWMKTTVKLFLLNLVYFVSIVVVLFIGFLFSFLIV